MTIRRELSVGIFVVLGLVLFMFLTVTLRNWDFLARRVTYHVRFESIERLAPGATVLARGAPVGTVTRIEFVGGEHGVRVTVRINPNVDLREDAIVRVVAAPIIGETTVNIIEPGSVGPPLAPYSEIIGQAPAQLDQIAVDLSQRVGQVLSELLPTLRVINEMVGDTEHQEQVRTTLRNIAAGTESMQQVLTRFDSEFSPLLAELYETQATLNRFLEVATTTTLALQEQAGQVSTNANQTFAQWTSAADSIRAGVEASSVDLNRLIDRLDQAIARNEDPLAQTLARLSAILERIEAGEGTLGALVTDRRPFDELRQLLATLSSSLTGRREPIYPLGPAPTPQPTPNPRGGQIMPTTPDTRP